MPRRLIYRGTGQSAQTAYPAAAGTWRAAGGFRKLTRPPSLPLQSYTKLLTVPIGNDGIANPIAFSGAGTAQLSVGPSGIGASWSPTQANAYTSVGPLDPASVIIYVGPLPAAQYAVVSALAGGAAQIALGGVALVPGWFIWAVWAGGTPGAEAKLYVTGTKTVLTTP